MYLFLLLDDSRMKGQNMSWKIIINEHIVFWCCAGLDWVANNWLVQLNDDVQIFIVNLRTTKCFRCTAACLIHTSFDNSIIILLPICTSYSRNFTVLDEQAQGCSKLLKSKDYLYYSNLQHMIMYIGIVLICIMTITY